MSLTLVARKKFPVVADAKSLLKIIRGPTCGLFKFLKITHQNGRNRNCRQYSTKEDKDEVVKSQTTEGEVPGGIFETVKSTTKTLTYSGLVVIGLGVTGLISYAIFTELFSKNSPMNIYSKALERCLKNDKVLLSLGEPIKAFGEENSIGRRLHTNHLLYKKDGVDHLRMNFYIKGSRNKATVHLEMVENENKNFVYRYLFVQLDEFPYTTIVLEDNRGEKPSYVQPINGQTEKMELT